MKPFQLVIFGVSVFIVSVIVSLLVIYFHPQLFGYKILVPKGTFFNTKEVEIYKDISHIVQITQQLSDTALKNVVVSDSIVAASLKLSIISKKIFKNQTLFKFEFPESNDTLLYSVYREFDNAKTQLVRVMHYGDSQIEGDRITSYLRQQMQQRFGGCGIGFIPVIAVAQSSLSYNYVISDNWKRFSVRSNTLEQPFRRRTGPLFSFARMTSLQSIWNNKTEIEGKIHLQHSNIGYPNSQYFEQCRIFYGFNASPMIVQMKQGAKVLDAEIVPASNGLQELQWVVSTPNDIQISFQTKASPDVYGIALDGLTGVAVDNIPLRGSQGLDFSKTDLRFLKRFYEKLNVKLLILQFGPNIVTSYLSDFATFELKLNAELAIIRKAIPGVSIIIIGVNDMSKNSENGYVSYSNIEKIRDIQRNAAFTNNCAFWDLLEVMGGRNSMPGWVFANPPLAQKDFIHFSPLGAKTVAELFYRAFMDDYGKYKVGNSSSLK